MAILLRVGLPKSTGALPGEAERLGVAALISASSLWDSQRGHFREPGSAIGDLNVALDSAGFTAMCHYGGFPWPLEAYVELAFAYDWAWWSQPDLCCEPEIAPDRAAVLDRVIRSAALLADVRQVAARLRDGEVLEASRYYTPAEWWEWAYKATYTRFPDPMPVLQGWLPADYLVSADAVERVLDGQWPELVGVGSVCRRHVHGDAGLLAVLGALHARLPSSVKVHLFGVKGNAIPRLLPFHDRVASIDSMAWDVSARRKGESSMDARKGAMRRWVGRQRKALAELERAALLERVLGTVRTRLPAGLTAADLDGFLRRNRPALEVAVAGLMEEEPWT